MPRPASIVLTIGGSIFLLLCAFIAWQYIQTEPPGAVLDDQIQLNHSLIADSIRVPLSRSERQYLNALGPITVAPDPYWPPFEFIDANNRFVGIAADLLAIIAQRLGIEFNFIIPEDWEQAIRWSQAGEVLILPFLNQTPDRDEWLIFTDPLLVDPNVFITREEHPFITDPAQLYDLTMVLPSGTAIEERVRQHFPQLLIRTVDNENDVFRAVSEREADLTLRSLIIAAYTIRKEGLFNLKIAGQAPDPFTNRLRIGVLKEHELLRDILNKGIATLSQREIDTVVNRHVNIVITQPIDYTWAQRIGAALLLILLVSLFWNLRLRRINALLAESERSKSVIIDNLPAMVYRCDFNKDWTMQMVSDEALHLTGFPPSALIGKTGIPFRELIHPDDREHLWQSVSEAVQNRSRIQLQYRIITANREERWVVEQAAPIFAADGSIVAIEGVIFDMTARRCAEQALLAANEDLANATYRAEELAKQADQASRAKSEFLANISHEIRTPLNAILGSGDLLLNSPLNPEQQAFINVIRNSGENLLAMIDDILDLVKLEAGKLELEPQVFSLPEIIQDLTQTLRPSAKEKDLALISEVDPQIQTPLWGDPKRLRQVLRHLLNNAIKFTQSGHIRISAQLVAATPSQQRIFFSINDTGIGMSAQKVSSLFQRFDQIDNSITRRFGGMGTGLSISRQLVELMQGSIKVESMPDEGSSFYFTLPFKPANASTPSGPIITQPQTRQLPKAHILVVEDNDTNQMIAKTILGRLGVHVHSAANGKEALLAIQSSRFDLILMDLQMPVMDGLSATQAIRDWESQAGRPRTPIVALTAHALQGDQSRCLNAGMDDYIAKPIRLSQMQNLITKWLAHH